MITVANEADEAAIIRAVRTSWEKRMKRMGATATRRAPIVPRKRTKVTRIPSREHIRLLRQSFSVVESKSGIAGLIFYRNLFTLDPSLRRLFHTSIELQGRKLMEALTYTIDALEQPKRLVPVLESLGRRHVAYKVEPEHYPIVITALLNALSEVLQSAFTSEVSEAWKAALNYVSIVMQRGAGLGQMAE